MQVFLTGATGSIGMPLTRRLVSLGHQVRGLARTRRAAETLRKLGAEPVAGNLDNAALLRQAAREADAVIHTAFTWDPRAAAVETGATGAFLDALAGTGKTLITTSGAAVLGDTGAFPAEETARPDPASPLAWRAALEGRVLAAKGIRSVVVRPSLAYGPQGHRIVNALRERSRAAGAGLYIGEGWNRWSTVHVDDLAALYALALEKAPAATLFHAASGTTTMRGLAEAISRSLGFGGAIRTWAVEEARAAIPSAAALAQNLAVSAERAVRLLGWEPSGPSLAETIASFPLSGR
jgi:nucleoside-diphosphate-sugar epimerase